MERYTVVANEVFDNRTKEMVAKELVKDYAQKIADALNLFASEALEENLRHG